MAEPSNPNLTIPETFIDFITDMNISPNKDNTSPTAIKTRDFSLILRPHSVLKKAVEALSDPTFNPKQEAMIQVGEYGFDITVSSLCAGNAFTEKLVIGYFRLKANELQEFKCNNPLQKTISLRSINRLFKDAAKSNTDSVEIFSGFGSNKLSFLWGKDFGLGFPISVDLHNVRPEQRKFPNVVTYGFEAVIPSVILKDTLRQVLRIDSASRPTNALATLKAPSVQMELGNIIVLTTEEEVEQHEIWVDWQFWDSLEKASCLADECSMYLVTDPPESVMLRFNLKDEVGDLVYLMEAQFLTENTHNDLPFLGLFRSLKVRRTFTR